MSFYFTSWPYVGPTSFPFGPHFTHESLRMPAVPFTPFHEPGTVAFASNRSVNAVDLTGLVMSTPCSFTTEGGTFLPSFGLDPTPTMGERFTAIVPTAAVRAGASSTAYLGTLIQEARAAQSVTSAVMPPRHPAVALPAAAEPAVRREIEPIRVVHSPAGPRPETSTHSLVSLASPAGLERAAFPKGIPSLLFGPLEQLGRLPSGCTPVLLMRHAEKEQLPAQGITPNGIRISQLLGRLLVDRVLNRILPTNEPGALICSPVQRCVQTLHNIQAGAAWALPAVESSSPVIQDPTFGPDGPLGDDIVLLINEQPAPLLKQHVGQFLKALLSPRLVRDKMNICVTHDILIEAVAAVLLDQEVQVDHLPGFLDGTFLWGTSTHLNILWKGVTRQVTWALASSKVGTALP